MNEDQIQLKINNFINSLDIKSHAVYVNFYDDLVKGSPAYSIGANLLGVPIGGVFISNDISKYIPKLTENELDFVISHELSHILLNHFPTSIILELPKLILDEAKEDWSEITKISIDFIKLIMILKGDLPPKENIKKSQEIEADMQAVYLTQDKISAISCIKKLAKGNILCGSHHSKIFDTNFPYLYFNERISAIEKIWI